MKVLPPAPITTCPLSLPGSPQVNGFLYELKMFLWKAMEKKTKTDSGNILLHMYPHFLSLGHHGCFSGIGLLCTLCSMASDCLQYTPLLVTRQCTVKHHTDIINFACMMWNFVRISASLSALCTNINQICH